MGRKYKNPPVVEVLCEFEFISEQPWDLTLPGLIYEKIKDEFPDKQQQPGISVQFRKTERGIEHKVEPAPLRIQFHRKDKSALIQIGPNLLVINQLKPYSTWEEFKAMILKNFQIYKEVANPKRFKKIGLRYINIVDFDKETVELKDYFRFYPYIPEILQQIPYDTFLNRVEFPYEDGKERLILMLASIIPSKPNVLISILLDIGYVMVTPEYVPFDSISEWLEKAHGKIEQAFESCITDNARKIFEEEKS